MPYESIPPMVIIAVGVGAMGALQGGELLPPSHPTSVSVVFAAHISPSPHPPHAHTHTRAARASRKGCLPPVVSVMMGTLQRQNGRRRARLPHRPTRAKTRQKGARRSALQRAEGARGTRERPGHEGSCRCLTR